jgi:hypothetical protein
VRVVPCDVSDRAQVIDERRMAPPPSHAAEPRPGAACRLAPGTSGIVAAALPGSVKPSAPAAARANASADRRPATMRRVRAGTAACAVSEALPPMRTRSPHRFLADESDPVLPVLRRHHAPGLLPRLGRRKAFMPISTVWRGGWATTGRIPG